VVFDPRQSWQTNGALIALLRFSRMALVSPKISHLFDDSKALEYCCEYYSACNSQEFKNYMNQILICLHFVKDRHLKLEKLMSTQITAACA
jgi:hypothetical protein